MSDMKSGMNMRSEAEGTMPQPPQAVNQSGGNPLSAAVALVAKHNERADHNPNPMPAER